MKKIYGFIGAVLLFFCSDAIQAGTDLNLAAREAFYRNRVKDALLTYEERLTSYDSLISTLERQDKAYECIDAMLDYASAQNSLGQYLPALRRYEQVKGRLDSMHDGAQMRWFACKLRCLYGLGQVTMRLGFYSQSVHYFFDLLELCGEGKAVSDAKGKDGADGESAQQFGDSPRIGGSVSDQVLIKESYAVRAYSTLTLLFMNLDQESQAAYYLNRGRQLVLEADSVDRDAMWVYYNNWAGWYYVRNQFDSAVIVMQQAEKLIENEEERAIWSYNIGNIYMGIGESDLAKASLNSAISGKSDSSFWGYAHVISLVNLGFLYGLEQEYDLALDYYQRALEWAQKIGTRKIEATAYLEMAGLYKAKGGYKRALALYERGVALRDSLFGAEQQEQMNLLSQEYQQKEKAMAMEMLAKQLEYAELSNRHKNTILAILIVFLLIFCMSFCLALYHYFKERRQRKEKEQGFEKKNTEYKWDVEEKSKQLATLNLQLVQATETIAECRTEVKKLRYSKASETKEIQQRLEEILSAFNYDSAWEEFELCFNQVNSSFFVRLHEACPELSRTEQRICALLVLNLSVKEIAGITHRSIRTVEASIYQIRKKMAIPAEVRTLSFLQDFLSSCRKQE
mgnify:FL=1